MVVGSDPESIQEDFEKLFDAIDRVVFDKVQNYTRNEWGRRKTTLVSSGEDRPTVERS